MPCLPWYWNERSPTAYNRRCVTCFHNRRTNSGILCSHPCQDTACNDRYAPLFLTLLPTWLGLSRADSSAMSQQSRRERPSKQVRIWNRCQVPGFCRFCAAWGPWERLGGAILLLRWERGIPGIHLADAPCRHTSSRSRSPGIPPFLMSQSLTSACEIWHAVRRRRAGAGHVGRCTEAVFKGEARKEGQWISYTPAACRHPLTPQTLLVDAYNNRILNVSSLHG